MTSPFDWKGQPSTILAGTYTTPSKGKNVGKTRGQIATEAVIRKAQETGTNPGTIHGLGADALRSTYRDFTSRKKRG